MPVCSQNQTCTTIMVSTRELPENWRTPEPSVLLNSLVLGQITLDKERV